MYKIRHKHIRSWEIEHGECFIDQNEHNFNGLTLTCVMIGRRPIIAKQAWEGINKEVFGWSIQQTLEIYEDIYLTEEEAREAFYTDFIWAVNTTEVTLRKVNDMLKEQLEADYGETRV